MFEGFFVRSARPRGNESKLGPLIVFSSLVSVGYSVTYERFLRWINFKPDSMAAGSAVSEPLLPAHTCAIHNQRAQLMTVQMNPSTGPKGSLVVAQQDMFTFSSRGSVNLPITQIRVYDWFESNQRGCMKR